MFEGMGQNEEVGIMCGDFIVFSFVLVGETCYNSIRRVCSVLYQRYLAKLVLAIHADFW